MPGWGAIIPFYNSYLLIKVAGRPGWWLILYFIPFVNIIIHIIVCIDVAKNFGHGAGYGILLWLFPFIMFLVLGFGSDQYQAGERLSRVARASSTKTGRKAEDPPPGPFARTAGTQLRRLPTNAGRMSPQGAEDSLELPDQVTARRREPWITATATTRGEARPLPS